MPNNKSIFCESIKCHHNEIANYILNNYWDKEYDNCDIQLNSVRSALQSYNYAFYPEDVTNSNYKFFPYYLCKFDYYNIVKYYIKNNRINFNVKFDLDKDRILNAFYVFFL